MRVTYHQLLCAEKKLLYCFTLASAVIFARKKRDIHVWKATHWGLHIEMHLAMSPLKKFHALLLASSDHHETDWWPAMKWLVVGREGSSRYENWSRSAVVTRRQLTLFFCSWTPWPPLKPPCLPPPYHEIHREKWCIDASRRGVTSRFLPIAVPYLHLPSALKVKEI